MPEVHPENPGGFIVPQVTSPWNCAGLRDQYTVETRCILKSPAEFQTL